MEIKTSPFKFRSWILPLCAMVFFIGTLILTQHRDIFISPDETAGAFFTNAFSQTGSFRVTDSLNQTFSGMLHPRSVVTDGGAYLPGSFLGLSFLYSFFLFFFGGWILTFITPVIAILAVFAWKKILEQWFSKRVAFVSAILLLFHPAFWYYSARGLMPNVLFVSLLIFGTYFLVNRPLVFHLKRCENRIGPLKHFQKDLDYVVAGLCFGSALFVRLAELYWVFPLVIFLVYAYRKQMQLRCVATFGVAFAIPLVTMLVLNTQTYGNPFVMGYTFISQQAHTIAATVTEESTHDRLSWIFPFGFHPRAIAKHVLFYLGLLFPWLTILSLAGLPIVLSVRTLPLTKGVRAKRIFVLLTILLALWLGIWYGSWSLTDNPDPTQITIANSYVRYWLPLFILSTPFMASALVWVSNKLRPKIGKGIVLIVCVLCVIGANFYATFYRGQDGLIRVEQTVHESIQIRAHVFDLTPADSVIIVDRADKLFFPYRHVLYPLRSEKTYALMPQILNSTSLYYYGVTLPQTDLDYLNQKKLIETGLHITLVQTFGIESLYHITRP